LSGAIDHNAANVNFAPGSSWHRRGQGDDTLSPYSASIGQGMMVVRLSRLECAPMTVVAWVLVFGLYYNNGFAISGIASEAACNELRQKIAAEYLYTPVPAMKCYSYEAAKI
jgi:hypothetical protein